jgi:hypothetical protein
VGDSDCNDYSGTGNVEDEVNFFPENTNMPAQNNVVVDPGFVGDYSGAIDGDTPDYRIDNPDCQGAFYPDGTDWTADWTEFPPN